MGNINYATINIAYKKIGINTKFVGLISSKYLILYLTLWKQLHNLVNLYITIQFTVTIFWIIIISCLAWIITLQVWWCSCQNKELEIYFFLVTQYFKGKWILKLKIALGGRETIAEGEGAVLAYLAAETSINLLLKINS